MNKLIYRIGKVGQDSYNVATAFDLTEKSITPMGGFPRYGIVNNDYIILKGSVPGPVRRTVTLRRSLFSPASGRHVEQALIKFVDTSSKFGHGRFQTSEEKDRVMRCSKRGLL